MIPVIALVGRPNVGKSTFFNYLTQSQDALVADFPGLTRDRQYGDSIYQKKPFIVVDTGGMGVDDLAIDTLMSKQSRLALNESDIIFFMVDAKAGLTPLDETIAETLRRLNKPIYLVVNKIDGLDQSLATSDFQKLGFETVYGISAAHRRGLKTLLDVVTLDFNVEATENSAKNDAIQIAFVGRPNVGKSTLINRMLGEERVVTYDMPGTTRDSIYIPFTRDATDYTLIDTAGVRRRGRVDGKIEKFSIIKTLQSIKGAEVCLMLLDANEGITDQDLHLLGFILEAGKALVIIVNKWDGKTEEQKAQVKKGLERKLQFLQFAQIRFISALHGSGVGHLFADIKEAYACANQRFATPALTRILQELVEGHNPPLVNGRRIKLRYAHTGGHNPPIVIIHGNQIHALPDSYKRYLINGFIQKLKLIGTPLRVEFKGSDNPFKNKKNVLTARQATKRKRLMKHIKRS